MHNHHTARHIISIQDSLRNFLDRVYSHNQEGFILYYENKLCTHQVNFNILSKHDYIFSMFCYPYQYTPLYSHMKEGFIWLNHSIICNFIRIFHISSIYNYITYINSQNHQNTGFCKYNQVDFLCLDRNRLSIYLLIPHKLGTYSYITNNQKDYQNIPHYRSKEVNWLYYYLEHKLCNYFLNYNKYRDIHTARTIILNFHKILPNIHNHLNMSSYFKY